MKKIFLSAAIIGLFGFSNAQTTQTSGGTMQSTKKQTMKEHVCTATCKDGKHVYAHGEKGHVCTDACKKKM